MHTILVDRELLERLDRLEQETEFIDAGGSPLGRFVPEARRVLAQVEESPYCTDPAERAAIMDRMIERMRRTPLSGDVPRLTRDELHERR